MKISTQWLREWVSPPVDDATLANQLTLAGLEIEAIESVAEAFDGVVVGHVQSVEPHPNADRLRVCQVSVGKPKLLQIVCGAPNVHVGMRAPCALVGANLLGGTRIKRSKLRGVESQGMLCSAVEIGLAGTSTGLLPLPEDAPIGVDIRKYLGLDDTTLEINVTPNRGDCLSVAGLARELGVLYRLPVKKTTSAPVPPTGSDVFPVQVLSEGCARYVGRVIRGVNSKKPTPLWMQERLRRSGIRSLGPLVDVTNYVMLELGQPMHAFDLKRLSGSIVVRLAEPGEPITLLDGTSLSLDPDTLVIADTQKVLAIAGIMGGVESGIQEDTTDLFLESAFFSPSAIFGKPRRYGLQTESSYRFERGVDPKIQRIAVERATQLLCELVGGSPGPIIEVDAPEPTLSVISLRKSRIFRLLGVDVPTETVEDILTRLGMQIERNPEGWQVTAPGFRFDVNIEADLIEEIARIFGYGQIQNANPTMTVAITSKQDTWKETARFFASRDYQEVITYSFVEKDLQSLLDPDSLPLALKNPLSSDLAVMRTNLWPGLIQAARFNLNRQQNRIRFFEMGRVFLPGEQLSQPMHIAGLALGPAYPEQWSLPSRGVDFFDVKGDLEAFFEEALRVEPCTHPALHPGQSADLVYQNRKVGWLGVLHPTLGARLELNKSVLLFELDLDAIASGPLSVFHPVSKFPTIRRDLAIIIRQEILAADLLKTVRETAGDLLRELTLFDLYMKETDTEKKSVGLGLTLQHADQTLEDKEVDGVVASVLEQLKQRFDASIRN
ncbi:phenylalanine--tRNA ligase subunit beta [Gammaproteobacteria bacterium]